MVLGFGLGFGVGGFENGFRIRPRVHKFIRVLRTTYILDCRVSTIILIRNSTNYDLGIYPPKDLEYPGPFINLRQGTEAPEFAARSSPSQHESSPLSSSCCST